MSNADKIRMLSPLLLFIFHAAYLTFLSPEPFLSKWLDGSFSLFLSLVLCNIVRAGIAPAPPPAGADEEDDEAVNGKEQGKTP